MFCSRRGRLAPKAFASGQFAKPAALTSWRPSREPTFSSPFGKKRAQQPDRLSLAHPRINLGPVQALVLRKHPRTVIDRAAFGIGRGIIEPGDAGVGNRAGTHRAWLQRDPQLAAIEAFVTQRLSRRANREDFGMCGWIAQLARGVMRGGDYRAVLDHHRADGHLARNCGSVRLIERGAHREGQGPVCHRPALARDILTAKK